MAAAEITAILEISKIGLIWYINQMKAAGLSDDQIDAAYKTAKEGMLSRDPDKIPA